MKSLEELAAIRDKMKSTVVLREGSNAIRIVVGMANLRNCGRRASGTQHLCGGSKQAGVARQGNRDTDRLYRYLPF